MRYISNVSDTVSDDSTTKFAMLDKPLITNVDDFIYLLKVQPPRLAIKSAFDVGKFSFSQIDQFP